MASDWTNWANSEGRNKIKIVFNPAAARGRASQAASQLRDVIHTFPDTLIEWVDTQYRGHGAVLARQAADAGFGVVVAMGGDGTVHEIVNGLMQVHAATRPALAVVPVGSGNDFVIGASLNRNPADALRRAIEPRETHWLDLGHVRDNREHSEYFVNVIGIGLDASVTYHSQHIKVFRGFAMYFAALMRTLTNNYGPAPMELEIDNGQPTSQEVLMLAVANGTREGGGFNITPRANTSDGQLDLAMIGPVSRLRLLQIIPDVMNGTHERHPEISVSRIQHLQVRSSQPLLSHFDGEMYTWRQDNVREMEISVAPKAVRLVT